MINNDPITIDAFDSAIDALIAYCSTIDELDDIDFTEIIESPADNIDPIIASLATAITLLHPESYAAHIDIDDAIIARATAIIESHS